MINFESFVDNRNSIILKQNPPSYSVILSLTPKIKNHIFFEIYYAFMYTYVILFLLFVFRPYSVLYFVFTYLNSTSCSKYSLSIPSNFAGYKVRYRTHL